MVKVTLIISIIVFCLACSVNKSSQKLSFPSLESEPNPGENGPQAGISILSTASKTLSLGFIPGNIVFDGNQLIWVNSVSSTNCFPSNTASFQHMTLNFSTIGTSTSTLPGISSTFSCNGRSHPLGSNNLGRSTMFWITSSGSNGILSVRDNSNGNILSNTSINVASYGCTGNNADSGDGPLFTYCNGLYYGACKSSPGNYLRLFSINSSGVLQSAVNTSLNQLSYGKINAMTCYKDNSLFLVTNYSAVNAYNAFYKFDLNFNLTATDPTTSLSFPTGLRQIMGIVTDGTSLYLQGREDNGSTPPTIMFGKSSLGYLQ